MTDTSTGFSSVSSWDDSTAVPTNPTRSPSRRSMSGGVVVQDSAALIGQNKWQQLFDVQPGRKQWTVVNTGANACELSEAPLGANQHGVTVAPGGTWTESDEDQLFVFCLGGTTLDISYTFTPPYDVISAGGGGGVGGNIPYIAPLLPGGATPID